MLLIDSLAEERIRAAMRQGEFDNLPGRGRPLRLEDEGAVPEDLRVAYRIMKNSGCLPPELNLRREIREVEALLEQVVADDERLAVRRRLCLLQARLALAGRESCLLDRRGEYRERILSRLAPAGTDGET